MTALAEILRRRIAAEGPISVADYMRACLLHPQHGYYMTRDPLGAQGDFTTAPEISQMFGELLGLALAQAWLHQGAPSPFVLAEPGPGRGTLMADILRATRGVAGFHDAARVHLIEVSPVLRKAQAAALASRNATWHRHLSELPQAPLLLVANEFFDALPIRQFVRIGPAWAERMVGLRDGALAFGLSQPVPLAAFAHRLADTAEGAMVETCPQAAPLMTEIAIRIARHGGAALVVDYGGWRAQGDTLQALHGAGFDAPLAHPGEADLTAHVDFEPLAQAARDAGAAVSGLTPQGVFLERLGITARAQALSRGRSDDGREALAAAHRRLTHPQEMGNLFKVLGVYPASAPPPPGTEAIGGAE